MTYRLKNEYIMLNDILEGIATERKGLNFSSKAQSVMSLCSRSKEIISRLHYGNKTFKQ